ncbi:MAG: hypothetical protein ABL962_09780, partial [Fimbriimonadaceae bacterium]
MNTGVSIGKTRAATLNPRFEEADNLTRKAMRVVPEARDKAILWALTHIEAFTSGGADIGLTPELVTKFEAMALSFSEAALEVQAKRTAYRCQVNSANEIEKQFREVAATCISAIK